MGTSASAMNARQSDIDTDTPIPTADELQADEHTHLLSNDDQTPSTIDAATVADELRLRTQLVVILFVCVLYLNLYICLAPEVSIRENIICKAYYDRLDNDGFAITGHPDRDCTVDDVQRELNLLSQVYVTIAQLPGFLLVFPYGVLADRIGRKKVLLLSVLGIVLCDTFKLLVTWQPNYFPLRAIWLAPLFRLLGGGDAVAATVVLAALADVYTEQDRTIVFARVASMATVYSCSFGVYSVPSGRLGDSWASAGDTGTEVPLRRCTRCSHPTEGPFLFRSPNLRR